LYRRRDDGQRVKIRGAELDNRWVVPYNPGLLMRYNCHINVEACSSIKAYKYLFKYVYKGHNCASFSVVDAGVINEIHQYRDARYISLPEAVHRIFGFHLFGVYPSVLQLQCHLPNMQSIIIDETKNLEEVVNNPKSSMTTLTEFFKASRVDSFARKLLYREMPEHYRWISGKKVWQRRKKGGQIGWIVYAHPAEGERYFLRVLLNHVRGPTSFEDLKTVAGIIYPTTLENHVRREDSKRRIRQLMTACVSQPPFRCHMLSEGYLLLFWFIVRPPKFVHCQRRIKNQCLKITTETSVTQK
jgi:hypothetical protein